MSGQLKPALACWVVGGGCAEGAAWLACCSSGAAVGACRSGDSAQKKYYLPPVNWRLVEIGDGYVGHYSLPGGGGTGQGFPVGCSSAWSSTPKKQQLSTTSELAVG
jgi:hypothetical protein